MTNSSDFKVGDRVYASYKRWSAYSIISDISGENFSMGCHTGDRTHGTFKLSKLFRNGDKICLNHEMCLPNTYAPT